jgi:protein-arginine kinase
MILIYTYSTDEEYQKIIAGEDGDEDEDEEDRIRRQFELADVDGSGNISLSEFLRLSRNMQHHQQQHSAADGEGSQLVKSGKDNLRMIAPGFAARLDELERRQQEQSIKLDRVLKLLEGA